MKIRKKITTTDNIYLKQLLIDLRKAKSKLWNKVALDLSRSQRQKVIVNVSKIEKYAKEKETVVVAGKVLSYGNISKPVDVYAFSFSRSAMEKITKAKGSCHYLSTLLKSKAKGVKIIG